MNGIVTGKVEKQEGTLVWKTTEKMDTSSVGAQYQNSSFYQQYIQDINQYLRIADNTGDIIIIKFYGVPIYENNTQYNNSKAITVRHDNTSVTSMRYGIISNFALGTNIFYITLSSVSRYSFSQLLPICEIGTFEQRKEENYV